MSAGLKTSAATPLQTALSWFPINDFFSLDIRSLALLRIGLGIMLLLEWLNRLVDVRMFFSDDGVVPRNIIPLTGTPISVFMLSGSAWFAGALMIIGCILAVLLLVGWRTQFVTVLSWFLLIGVQGRNFAIMQGGDVVMRMLLFWGMFLPLGACYSLDALRQPLREWRPRVLSMGSVAYIVQMCMIYWFAAAWKTDPAWRRDHTAVYLALSLEGFTTTFGHFLLNFPEFLKALTVATLILEIFGPAVLFIPFANGPLRTFVCASFIMFHTGLGLSLELGNFPPICCVAWLAVLPTWFWDQLEARLRAPKRSGLVVYFDGDNAWQRKGVVAARMFLLLYETKMVPAQQEGSRLARIRASGSWLVVDSKGREWVQYDAFLKLVRVSFLFWPLAPLLKRGPALYQKVADVLTWAWTPLRWLHNTMSRQSPVRRFDALVVQPMRRFGNNALGEIAELRSQRTDEAPATPDYPGARLGGWAQNAIVLFFLVYLIVWNIRTLDFSENKTQHTKDFPEQLNGLAYALALDQSWGLFAPKPGNSDGWYIIPAILKNGKVVDLYKDGGELTTAKPPLVSATYTNTRTRKYLMNLTSPTLGNLRYPYARYLIQNWNRSHGEDEQIEFMFIIYMLKVTKPDRQVKEVVEERLFTYPAYPEAALAASFGGAAPPLLQNLYNRPVLPELMLMKDRR